MDKTNCGQMKNKIILTISMFLLTGFCFAQNLGSFAGGFLRMGTSARAVAMGSSFTAEIDKGFAAYYNPSIFRF